MSLGHNELNNRHAILCKPHIIHLADYLSVWTFPVAGKHEKNMITKDWFNLMKPIFFITGWWRHQLDVFFCILGKKCSRVLYIKIPQEAGFWLANWEVVWQSHKSYATSDMGSTQVNPAPGVFLIKHSPGCWKSNNYPMMIIFCHQWSHLIDQNGPGKWCLQRRFLCDFIEILQWCMTTPVSQPPSNTSPGPIFCLLLRVSLGCAQPITRQVTSVTWPVIGWA